MIVDAVRTYLDAASGLTELTRKRAVAAAKALMRAGGDRSASAGAAAQSRISAGPAAEGVDGPSTAPRVGRSIQTLATELIETNRANRDALNDLVEAEVDRVLDRLDLVRRDDYDRLTRRVAELERRLAGRHAPVRGTADVGIHGGGGPSAMVTATGEDAKPSVVGEEAASGAEAPAEPAGEPSGPTRAKTPKQDVDTVPQVEKAGGDASGLAPEHAAAAEEGDAADAEPAADTRQSTESTESTENTGSTQKKTGNRSTKVKSGGARSRSTAKNGTKRSGARGKNSTSAKKSEPS